MILPILLLCGTLAIAAALDHRNRLVPHKLWIPCIIVSAIPVLRNWMALWPQPGLLITLALMIGMYLLSIRTKRSGADVLALIVIQAIFPVYLGIPIIIWLMPPIVLFYLLFYAVWKSDWDSRGMPFLIPLAAAVIVLSIFLQSAA